MLRDRQRPSLDRWYTRSGAGTSPGPRGVFGELGFGWRCRRTFLKCRPKAASAEQSTERHNGFHRSASTSQRRVRIATAKTARTLPTIPDSLNRTRRVAPAAGLTARINRLVRYPIFENFGIIGVAQGACSRGRTAPHAQENPQQQPTTPKYPIDLHHPQFPFNCKYKHDPLAQGPCPPW